MVTSTAPLWEEQVRVRSADSDFRRVASLEAICRIFFEAAWNHAESLGFGFSHLQAQHKAWVLSRLYLQVHRLPGWGAGLIARTWPRPLNSVFACREFQLLLASGEIMVSGTSSWLVIDTQSRRPVRPDRVLPQTGHFRGDLAAGRDPEKVASTGDWKNSAELEARYSDIDVNKHVNSARYVGFLIDSYPLEFLTAHSPRSLEINFLAETRLGDALLICNAAEGPDVVLHCIRRKEGQVEVARARLEWAKG